MGPSMYPGLVAAFASCALAGAMHAQSDTSWFNDIAFPQTRSAQAGQIALDPLSNQLVMLRNNGQTLAWTGSALQVVGSVATPLVGAAIASTDLPGLHCVVAFGGTTPAGGVSRQTLFYNGNGTWARVFPTALPPARTHASMASMNGQPVLFGGRDGSGRDLADTWVLAPIGTSGMWLEVLQANAPPPRSQAAMCPDGQGGLLLFGGRRGNTLLGDTWRMASTFGWQPVATPVAPPAGTGPMSFDPHLREIIHLDPALRVTHRFAVDSSTWQPLPAPGATMITPFAAQTPTGIGYMQFDPVRGEHVFVDQLGGVSVFSAADAAIRGRQPPSCAHVLGIEMTGIARIGIGYSVDISGATPLAPVWLATGTNVSSGPVMLPGTGCLAFFDTLLQLQFAAAAVDGTCQLSIALPYDPALIAFDLRHEAVDLASLGISDELVARIGRLW